MLSFANTPIFPNIPDTLHLLHDMLKHQYVETDKQTQKNYFRFIILLLL